MADLVGNCAARVASPAANAVPPVENVEEVDVPGIKVTVTVLRIRHLMEGPSGDFRILVVGADGQEINTYQYIGALPAEIDGFTESEAVLLTAEPDDVLDLEYVIEEHDDPEDGSFKWIDEAAFRMVGPVPSVPATAVQA
jgi:hypothetical protein